MPQVNLKNGKSYTVSTALAESVQKAIKNGNDRGVYYDNVNGSFTLVMDDVKSVK